MELNRKMEIMEETLENEKHSLRTTVKMLNNRDLRFLTTDEEREFLEKATNLLLEIEHRANEYNMFGECNIVKVIK